MPRSVAQWYALFLSILFLAGVGFTLIVDTLSRGASLETVHKLTHIIVGAFGLLAVKSDKHSRAWCWFNGIFYGVFAAIGWAMPDFLSIDAFNRVDTVLHSIVAATAFVAAWWRR